MRTKLFSARRWRTTTVLVLGAAIGIMLVAQPAGAHFLPSINHIWNHIKPKADQRYVRIEGTLPHGKTLTGTWTASAIATGAAQPAAEANISFEMPLASAPTVKVVPNGGPVPTGCSGSVSNPHAASGNLCLFVGWNINTTTPDNIQGTYRVEDGAQGVSRRGTVVFVWAAGAGLFETTGTYAVTAGSSGSPRVVSPSNRKGGGS